MNKEIWKDVKGFENLYQVSNLGNVRSLIINRKLTIQTTGNYNHISLMKENKKINCTIHRLVAEAFIPNPNNLPEINHIDENTRNNNVNNLEWCDHKYNINYGNRTKIAKEKMSKSINQYDMNYNFIKTWDCINDAIRYYKNSHIVDVCKGKRKRASGYIWKYKKGEVYE